MTAGAPSVISLHIGLLQSRMRSGFLSKRLLQVSQSSS